MLPHHHIIREKGETMNLSQIFNQQHKREERELEFPLKCFGDMKVIQASPLFLSMENTGKGKAKIKGSCELIFSIPCDRCLTPVETKLSLEFSRVVYAPDMDIPKEEEDQQFVEEYELNLERLLEEELQLLWPTKTLCSEDCKGICMKCGQNRNEGSCDCDDFVPVIRFANLMDIFNGKK